MSARAKHRIIAQEILGAFRKNLNTVGMRTVRVPMKVPTGTQDFVGMMPVCVVADFKDLKSLFSFEFMLSAGY